MANTEATKSPLFNSLLIETVNRCTRECWFCKFGQPRQAESFERMPWELIEKIVDNLVDLDFTGRVSWFKINEPMVDKRIFDIVALTKRKLPRCFCSLVSNGDLITDEVITKFRQAGLDRLGISVYDHETFKKMQSLQQVQFLKLIDHRTHKESAFVENRGGNIQLVTLATQKQLQDDFTDRDCKRPSTSINVTPDGTVVLCCADFYRDVVLGNVATQRLEEVWYGETLSEIRDKLATSGRRGLKLCEGCTHEGKGHFVSYP
jgi:radical SAM protein with 4Fe4S-binding SPASM domain